MEKIKWLSDYPIESESEDALAFGKVADVFSEMIVECDTPFTIGINGEWGSGKTSLMKLIKAKIETNSCNNKNLKIRTTWFDTWSFANEKEIWKLLMISLIEDLGSNNSHEYDVEKLVSSVLNLGEIAATALATGGINLYSNRKTIIENTKNIFDARKSKEEAILKNKVKSIKSFRQEFESLVNCSVGENGRYIIFIDDLDRVIPDKTIDIIESIKTFLDCKQCIFVIGCDYQYLDACIEKRYTGFAFNARDYIDKIVQITFEVSSLNNHLFNVYLSKNIISFFTTKDDFKVASNLIHQSLGRNPRKIKKLTNLYSIVHNLNDKGLDNCLILKLICFLQTWPDAYKNAISDFNENIYTFKKYQDWALPIRTWEEFIEYDPSWYEEDDIDFLPPDEAEEYAHYEGKMSRIKEEIENKLRKTSQQDVEISKMNRFLQAPPFFPYDIKDLAPYLAAVQSIDLQIVKMMEAEALNKLPTVNEIYDLFEKVEILVNGQLVDGKYFNSDKKIVLPVKDKRDEDEIIINTNIGHIGRWFYTIIDSKKDDEYILDLIKKFKNEKYDTFWIISPWGFSKSIREFTKQKPKIHISSYSSLEDLYDELSSEHSRTNDDLL